MSKKGDHKTMRQRIMQEVSRLDAKAEEMANLYIASAINRYRHRKFWFNTSNFTFTAVVGQSAYSISTDATPTANEIPWDFIRVMRMESRDSSNSDVRNEIKPASIDQVDDELGAAAGTNGRPEFYTYHDTKIHLAPEPDQTYTISVEYVKDIGTPGAIWNPGTTKFLLSDPDDDTASLSDSYTNAWYTHAEELIRGRAKRMFYADYLKDAEGAAIAAEAERIAFSEIKGFSKRHKSQFRQGWS